MDLVSLEVDPQALDGVTYYPISSLFIIHFTENHTYINTERAEIFCHILTISMLQIIPNLPFLDPPFWGAGPMYPGPSVCPSVCPSVRDKSSHTSHHRISQIFCMKLQSGKWRKVTKPDFRKKNVGARNRAKTPKIGPKMGFSAIFSSLIHQILVILHILIGGHDVQLLV